MPNHLANKDEIGSVWGLAYNQSTKQLFTATFLKRHAGNRDTDADGQANLGVIWVTSDPYLASPTNSVWADLSKPPYNIDLGTIGSDASRGLGLPTAPSNDPTAFPLIGKVGLGDIDIAEDGKSLWVVTPKTNQLHRITINADGSAGAMQSFTVPSPCTDVHRAMYIKSGGSLSGKLVDDFTGDEYFVGGSTLASTGRTGTAYSSARTGTNFSYLVPLATGAYNVTLSFGNNGTIRSQTVSVGETTQSVSLSANATSLTFFSNISVADLLTIQVGSLNATPALLSGIRIVSATGQNFVDRSWPFALAYRNGNVYVGTTCPAELSQDPARLSSTVYQLPDNGSATFTPVLTVPLTYRHGRPHNNAPAADQWLPWTGAIAKGVPFAGTGWTYLYPQPVLSDIDFLDDGDMVLGFFDRFGHQTGDYNYATSGSAAGRTTVAGEILRADFTGSTYTLESNGRVGTLVSGGGVGNRQGPGGGEFYYQESYLSSHEETSFGGIAVLPGRNEVAITALNPFNFVSSGVFYLSNTNGSTTRKYQITPTSLNNPQFFTKANGLGDLQVLCDLPPIQIGNRVWRDDNRNGIQDPCEPAIAGAVVRLYNAAKTTLLASATTNAAGQYYFQSGTVVAGASTSAVTTTALTYNTIYGLVLASLGSSTVVTSQGLALTDVSPLTPGESGTANSGNTISNNDAKLDAIGGASLPAIRLITGGAGENNHTYDFGVVKNPNVCTSVPTTVCAGQPFAIRLTTETGYDRYQWLYKAPGDATATVVADGPSNSFTATLPGEYNVIGTTQSVTSCPDGSCCPVLIEERPAPVPPGIATQSASCGSVSAVLANADGRIILSTTALSGLTYDITKGNSFTASAPLFGSAQPLPTQMGSVLASGLSNPVLVTGDQYTIRIYQGDCFVDVVLTLQRTACGCPEVKCVPITVVRKR